VCFETVPFVSQIHVRPRWTLATAGPYLPLDFVLFACALVGAIKPLNIYTLDNVPSLTAPPIV